MAGTSKESYLDENGNGDEIDMGQSIKRNSRKWQCDELPVDFPLGEQAMRGLVLHEPRPHALLVQPVEQEEIVARKGLFDEVSAIAAAISMPLAVAFITVRDWNQELSPWQAPAVFGKQDFGAGAGETLKSIERILPMLKRRYDLPAGAPVVLGGYSLAALFSLWSAYESRSFDAIAAASPSVWFPGWLDYAKAHVPKVGIIYLSLGNREDKTRNPVMRTVRTCIENQHALLQEAGIKTTLEWNPGNHFQHPEQRCTKAFDWCFEQLSE
nr:esterase [Mitsuokella multacida]